MAKQVDGATRIVDVARVVRAVCTYAYTRPHVCWLIWTNADPPHRMNSMHPSGRRSVHRATCVRRIHQIMMDTYHLIHPRLCATPFMLLRGDRSHVEAHAKHICGCLQVGLADEFSLSFFSLPAVGHRREQLWVYPFR